MKTVAQAQLRWLSVEDGGRRNIIPCGIRYCPIMVFEAEQVSETLWSSEIYNKRIEGRVSIADVSYLMDDAPFHLLKSGGKFSLYEGQRVVAEGNII